MTNASEKRKVVEYIVRDIFLTELKEKVAKTMGKYTLKLQRDERLRKMTGLPCIVQEATLFEISEPTQKLIENIMILFDDEKQIGIQKK